MTEEQHRSNQPPPELLDDEEPDHRRLLLHRGRQLVPKLWGLIRTLGMYDVDNETPQRALASLTETLEEILEVEEAVALIAFGDAAFLNGVRLRLDRATYRLVRRLSEFLNERTLGGLCIHREFTQEDLLAFLQELRRVTGEEGRQQLEELLEEREIAEITLINPHQHQVVHKGGGGEEVVDKRGALEIYARAMFAMADRSGTLAGGIGVSRRQTVAVRRLVVLAEGDEETFLQLAALRGLGSPLMNHALNVTILSLTLGRNLGLARKHLVQLGIAALNHNIGEMLTEDGELDASIEFDGRNEVELAHPLLGMRHLLAQHGPNQRSLQRALVAAEHHRHFDGVSGFPEMPPAQPHLFSRIVAVSDAYDWLVWSPHEDTRLPPDQALRRVVRGSGTLLDPVLVRVFAAMIGRYPPGCLVELDDGDLAVVLARGRGEDGQARPRVMHIRDAMGNEVPLRVLDLSERFPGRRRYKATIVRTRDPVRLKINVGKYMFAAEGTSEAGTGRPDAHAE